MPLKNRIRYGLLIVFAVMLPIAIAYAAGGRIEGRVTDPKGDAVVGASVTITDEVNNQRFSAVTDQQGRYKIEGLP
ncbi:MAG TPA: carboxypeptidase-like regulatory domain-containing protein, partial [Pyrinomonadaceae bacterium]|nr:carboxypeptidase-like regulatory domain-containing protein [Pyrinomonadaceae bacterium]